MQYRAEIDGLRAFAVVPVILFHAGFDIFSGGFVGVDVFFVISGYLITSIILAEKEAGTFSIIRFYERRARRILPALFFVMAASLPFAWLWLLPSDMEDFSESLIAVPIFASNILFWWESGYFEHAAELKPMLHTWSLAIEEQYYLLFPPFLLIVWKLGKRWIFSILIGCGMLSLALAQWGAYQHPSATFFLLPTRGWEILMGALVAFYLCHKPDMKGNYFLSLLGLILIVFSIFTFDSGTPFPSLYAVPPTFGVALIILFAREKTLVHTILSNKIVVGMGLLSYSAYLWHQPIFAFARHKIIGEPSLWVMLVLAIASGGLAYLSWRFIEAPFRDRHNFSAATIFKLSALGSVFFIAFGAAGHLSAGFPNRISDKAKRFILEQYTENPRQSECHLGFHASAFSKPLCTLGNKNKIIGAFIGDSHANAISQSLAEAFEAKGWGVKSLTTTSCPATLNVTRIRGGRDTGCLKQNSYIYDKIIHSTDAQYIIIHSRWTMYLEGWNHAESDGLYPVEDGEILRSNKEVLKELIGEKYKKTIKSYLDAGKEVVLIYPIPEIGWDASSVISKELFFGLKHAREPDTSYKMFLKRNQRTIDVLDSIGTHDNLHRVRPDKVLCNSFVKDRCIFQLNGVPLYYDDNHLNYHGGKLIVSKVMQYIKKQQ